MHARATPSQSARELFAENLRFYDGLWSGCRLVEPHRFNTWPLVQRLLAQSRQRLEVAPGLRPRLPIEGTQFADISQPALARLRERGGVVTFGEITALPFADRTFDLVCALDIVEHVEDEDSAFSELARVAEDGATVLLSTPLHPAHWTAFDDFVGHKRRYEPSRLLAKLSEYRLNVESSAVFGMQPRSSLLLDMGMWWLTHQRKRAMWWYNRAFPLGLRFQKELQLVPGLVPTDGVDEILLVCRRQARDTSGATRT
ncbi:MAG TPA: class I SAM-dependent methyltransferase [Steroidobacteraceae bacterium]|nr:class I SAM-dependent methyltransferase [Steroidobacteraceae bacterium]